MTEENVTDCAENVTNCAENVIRGHAINFRVGHGFDAHRLIGGDHVVIGGVRIPHTARLEAWSDGDVLIHAICDALFGAAGIGDIGQHFPNTDPSWQGADSLDLLREAVSKISHLHFRIVNVDSTVVAQAPKLAPHVQEMRDVLSQALCVDVSRVNIKATTSEGLGYTGRGEGIAAHAVVLLTLD